jgi:hypothetical protein
MKGHVTGCTGKSAFTSWSEANKRARRMRKLHKGHVEAYHCLHCNSFHVGEARSYGKRGQRVAPMPEEA